MGVHFVTTKLTYKWWVVATVRPSPVAVRSPPNFHCRLQTSRGLGPLTRHHSLVSHNIHWNWLVVRPVPMTIKASSDKSDNISKSGVSTSLHCPTSRHCIHRLADHWEPPQIGPQNEPSKHPKHVFQEISENYIPSKLWLFKQVSIRIFERFLYKGPFTGYGPMAWFSEGKAGRSATQVAEFTGSEVETNWAPPAR